MKRTEYGHAVSCVGAVIGAGFASGREVIVFFTQYGVHAVWLTMLAVVLMAGLCALCIKASQKTGKMNSWTDLFEHSFVPSAASFMLLTLTSGAMLSAAGHMTALLWCSDMAYPAGVLGSLLTAWLIGYRSIKPLGWVSAVLTLMLLIALMICLSAVPPAYADMRMKPPASALVKAAFRATGYASMNMTLAIGVVSRGGIDTGVWKTAGLFGWLMAILLLISNSLYGRHPELVDTAFPIVRLLAEYGRTGYFFSIWLLYLSILTTLISVIYALRSAVEAYTESWSIRILLVITVPLAVSKVGFSDIVERLYAPAGLICLLIVFLPLLFKGFCRQEKQLFLDISK